MALSSLYCLRISTEVLPGVRAVIRTPFSIGVLLLKKIEQVDYVQWSSEKKPDFLLDTYLTKSSPLPWYAWCDVYMCETRVLYGNVNSERYLIQMPGRACDNHNVSFPTGRLADALAQGAKFSRVDFAVTVNEYEPLELFRIAVANGKVKSDRFGSDEPKMIAAVNGDAQTIYLGDLKKRGKKGVFRAYDKGLEQGLDTPSTRFELEVRGRTAHTAVRRFLRGIPISALIRAVVDIPGATWWDEIFIAPPEKLPRFKQPEKTDITAARWHWLYSQVAPALGKLLVIERSEGTQNYAKFLSRVRAAELKAMWVEESEQKGRIDDT